MKTIKVINIKNQPYYIFNDTINTKIFDLNLFNIGKISFKSTNIDIYYIEYITMKSLEHVNVDSQNPLYLIFDNVDGYIEESNEDKYLIFSFRGKNKEVLKNYAELWNDTKNEIETINGSEPIENKKRFHVNWLESDDNLPWSKILSIPNMIIVTRSLFQEDNKYYPQVYLHE